MAYGSEERVTVNLVSQRTVVDAVIGIQLDMTALKVKYTFHEFRTGVSAPPEWRGMVNLGYILTNSKGQSTRQVDGAWDGNTFNLGGGTIGTGNAISKLSIEDDIPSSGKYPPLEISWQFIALGNADGPQYNWRNQTLYLKQDVTIDISSRYCTAPTNVTIQPESSDQGFNGFVKPGARVRMTWQMGQGGQNNPIDSYYVYCAGASTRTSNYVTEATLTLGQNLTRGKTYTNIYVESESDYNDARSSNNPSIVINRLAEGPQIICNGEDCTNKTLGDLDADATIQLKPGKVYNNHYGVVQTDTGAVVENYLIKADAYKRYEFWTFDGLEVGKSSYVIVSPKPAMTTEYTSQSPVNEFYLYPEDETRYPKARGFSFRGKVNDLGDNVTYNSTGKIYYGDTPTALTEVLNITPDYADKTTPAINVIALSNSLEGKFYKAELTCTLTASGETMATLTEAGPICYCPKPTGIKSHKIVGDLGGTYANQAMNNKYLDVTIEPTLTVDATDSEYASLKYWRVESIASDGLVSGQALAQIESVQPSYRIPKAEIEQGDRVGTILYGEEYRVRITLYDGAYEYVINDTATRVEAPQWGAGNFNTLNLFTDGNNKPYSRYYVAPRTKEDAGLTFTFPKIKDGKWEDLQYKLFFYLDNEEQGTHFTDFTPNDSSAMQNFHISADFWKDYLINYPALGAGDPLKPLLYDLPFRITIRVVSRFEGAEIWSEEVDLTPKNSYIKIKEKPYFPEESIKIVGRHSWSKEYLDHSHPGQALPLESALPQNFDYVGQQIDGENSILVNPDEYLTFKFTAARDYNHNDVQYRLKANGIRVGEEHLTTVADTIGDKELLTYTLLNDESLRGTVGEDIPVIFTIEAFDADEATLGATSIILDNVIYLTHTGKPDFGIPSLLPGRGIPQGETDEITGAKLGTWVLKYWGGSSLPDKLQNLNRPNLTLQEEAGTVIEYQSRNFLAYKVKDKATNEILVNKEIALDPDIRKANKEQILYLDPEGADNSKELLVEFTLKVSTGFGASLTPAAAREFEDKFKYETSEPVTVGYIPRIPLIYPRPRQIGINGLPQPEDVVTIRTISSLSDTSWVTFRNTRGEITLRLNADSGEIQLATIDCGTY